jgi:hypothetical protein
MTDTAKTRAFMADTAKLRKVWLKDILQTEPYDEDEYTLNTFGFKDILQTEPYDKDKYTFNTLVKPREILVSDILKSEPWYERDQSLLTMLPDNVQVLVGQIKEQAKYQEAAQIMSEIFEDLKVDPTKPMNDAERRRQAFKERLRKKLNK